MSARLSAARIALKRTLKALLAMPGLAIPRRRGLRVLFYHRINDHPFEALGPVSREISVSSEAFDWQLGMLRQAGYRSVTLAEAQAMLEGRARLDPKAVLITFDDGYADNLEVAAPLLRAHGFTATVFVVPGFLGREAGTLLPDAEAGDLGRFLSVEELRSLRDAGIEIGSHTLTHPLLTTIAETDRRREVADSRTRLEATLGGAITSFSYPGGDFDGAVEQEVARAGYALAFTTIPGVNRPGARTTALRRTEVSASDGRFVFRMKMAGALDWLAFKEGAAFRRVLRALNALTAPLART